MERPAATLEALPTGKVEERYARIQTDGATRQSADHQHSHEGALRRNQLQRQEHSQQGTSMTQQTGRSQSSISRGNPEMPKHSGVMAEADIEMEQNPTAPALSHECNGGPAPPLTTMATGSRAALDSAHNGRSEMQRERGNGEAARAHA